jgi:hypothetical protein
MGLVGRLIVAAKVAYVAEPSVEETKVSKQRLATF